MMDCIARRRTDLDPLHPLVFLETGRKDDVLIFNRAPPRHVEWLGHFDDSVRLANFPALRPLAIGRPVSRIAFRSAGAGPRGDGVDFALRKRPVIREMSEARVGKPRRHSSSNHRFAYRLGPGPGLQIGQQRHWRDLARPVALLASLLEYRQNVLVEGRAGGGGCRTHW